MQIQKIAKFEKHTEDSYSVWYEILGTDRVILNKVRFDLAQCIDEFIRRGIDPKDISRILDLANLAAFDDALSNSY